MAEPCLLVPQEMAESIRHHTTIEPCDGASESGEDQDKDSHELVEDFEDSGKAAVGRRTRAQMSAGHVEMAGSGGTEMGACNEEEAWQRIEAEEVEEERSRREQLREMLQRGGGQEVGDEEGSGEVQEGDEEEEEMSWGAAGVEVAVTATVVAQEGSEAASTAARGPSVLRIADMPRFPPQAQESGSS